MNGKAAAAEPAPRAIDLDLSPGSLAARAPPPRLPPEPMSTHLRAAALIMVLAILVGGIGYPLAVTGVAQLVDPSAANGSLIRAPNGTILGSALVASPILLPWAFWPRPSEVGYNMYNGSDAPPGPTDPALVNETLSYLAEYSNGTGNVTIPLWLITPSGSGVDPDITPASAYVQVPRVAVEVALTFHVTLSNRTLDGLVSGFVQEPPGGIPGPSYVDVNLLNLALWEEVQG